MASLEEDFPRGGTAKKPTESKIVVQRTEVDNLFQVELNSSLFVSKILYKEFPKLVKDNVTMPRGGLICRTISDNVFLQSFVT